MEKTKAYDPKDDPQFQEPFHYSDRRGTHHGIACRMVHGGFRGTSVKFLCVFPEKDAYRGRFYQFLSPFPGPDEELASLERQGAGDYVGFALTHGAYFVESNMGSQAAFGSAADDTLAYRSSAAVAEYSRQLAVAMYGCLRPFAYVFGGGGGGFRAISCVENTGVFDGAVPLVFGSPVTIPYSMTIQPHGKRLLRRALPRICDALEPGGSGDVYAVLGQEEKEALVELGRFGFPLRAWLQHDYMGDASLRVLIPAIKQADSGYFNDFWEKPGYLGAEPDSAAKQDRIRVEARVAAIWPDEAGRPVVSLDTALQSDYPDGCDIHVLTGAGRGQTLALHGFDGDRLVFDPDTGLIGAEDAPSQIKPGDKLLLDNSDYIAIQSYHRHQVPDRQFTTWDQYRDDRGRPLYPQRESQLHGFRGSGVAAWQHGRINGKMIAIAATEDEVALPWQPDWYRQQVAKAHPGHENDLFRLWYHEHANHGGMPAGVANLHLVSYLGAMYQALISVSEWVERGIEPNNSSRYAVDDGQVVLASRATMRHGVQPLVRLSVRGEKSISVHAGDEVEFEAVIELPKNGGRATAIEFSFEGESDYPAKAELELTPTGVRAGIAHRYNVPGTYFAVARGYSCLSGDSADPYLQIANLDRVRVVVD